MCGQSLPFAAEIASLNMITEGCSGCAGALFVAPIILSCSSLRVIVCSQCRFSFYLVDSAQDGAFIQLKLRHFFVCIPKSVDTCVQQVSVLWILVTSSNSNMLSHLTSAHISTRWQHIHYLWLPRSGRDDLCCTVLMFLEPLFRWTLSDKLKRFWP